MGNKKRRLGVHLKIACASLCMTYALTVGALFSFGLLAIPVGVVIFALFTFLCIYFTIWIGLYK